MAMRSARPSKSVEGVIVSKRRGNESIPSAAWSGVNSPRNTFFQSTLAASRKTKSGACNCSFRSSRLRAAKWSGSSTSHLIATEASTINVTDPDPREAESCCRFERRLWGSWPQFDLRFRADACADRAYRRPQQAACAPAPPAIDGLSGPDQPIWRLPPHQHLPGRFAS
jgi:hypothetical protein